MGNSSFRGTFKVAFLPCLKGDPEVVRPVCVTTLKQYRKHDGLTALLCSSTFVLALKNAFFLPRMLGEVSLLDFGN